jgi:hypothetical protein
MRSNKEIDHFRAAQSAWKWSSVIVDGGIAGDANNAFKQKRRAMSTSQPDCMETPTGCGSGEGVSMNAGGSLATNVMVGLAPTTHDFKLLI